VLILNPTIPGLLNPIHISTYGVAQISYKYRKCQQNLGARIKNKAPCVRIVFISINRRTIETSAYNQQPIPVTLEKFKAAAYEENLNYLLSLLGYRDRNDEGLGEDRRDRDTGMHRI
jgi:hypothetical protein